MSPHGAQVGDRIGPATVELTRADLVRYAGASGDFNPIHYSDLAARSAGLPGVIAHGMATMGKAIWPLVDWAGGDPGAVEEYAVRFSHPVPVPESGSVALVVTGQVRAVEPETVTVNLTVTLDGAKVLGKAQVRLSAGSL